MEFLKCRGEQSSFFCWQTERTVSLLSLGDKSHHALVRGKALIVPLPRQLGTEAKS